MIYLLDSNVWISWLRQNDPRVVGRIQQESAANICLCSVVLGELVYGAHYSGPLHRLANLARIAALQQRFTSLPYDDRAAEEYGRVRAELARSGMSIGPNDLLIAAIALSNGLTLVTHNTAEFGRVRGLAIEDWR